MPSEREHAEDLDTDALAIAAAQAGVPLAVAARLVGGYRAIVEMIDVEPDWRAQTHMHGPGFSCSTYAAEGCPVSMTLWSYPDGKSERAYGIPHRQRGFPTFREALAAHRKRSYRAGPRRAEEAPHAE